MDDEATAERADPATAHTILREANRAHGTNLTLNDRFTRGFQAGTWMVTDRVGRHAVFKWSPNRNWAPRVLTAADSVVKVRAAGYPTSEWLAVGVSSHGYPYHVQRFAQGRQPDTVTADVASVLIELLESQASLDPNPCVCWSHWVTDSLQDLDGHLWEQMNAIGPLGQQLAETCHRLLTAHGSVSLPTGDLVHGDFRPGNILLDNGRVTAVIDIEQLGSGTRAYDYATLLTEHNIEPEAQDMIIDAGSRVAGRDGLGHCFAVAAMGLADFIYRGDHKLDPATMARLRMMLTRIRP